MTGKNSRWIPVGIKSPFGMGTGGIFSATRNGAVMGSGDVSGDGDGKYVPSPTRHP